MVGIVGGEIKDEAFDRVTDAVTHGDWYEREVVANRRYTLGVLYHGEKGLGNYWSWQGNTGCGVLYGAITNKEILGLQGDELFRSVLESPDDVLPKLNGSFAIACADGDEGKLVFATDKMKHYPSYYTRDGRFAFASEMTALLPIVDEPTLDVQTVGDFVMTDWTWGDETLVEEVADLRPASYVSVSDGERCSNRYWEFEYGRPPNGDYVEGFAGRYGAAVSDVVNTVDDDLDVGVWLSGGLDSRTLAALTERVRPDVRTLTYDANPSGGENFGPARDVADQLGVENEAFEFTPEAFAEALEEGVRLTDGMVSWVNYHDLVLSMQHLRDEVDVLVNGSPTGGLIGEEMWPIHLQGGRGDGSIVDQVFHRHARMDREEFDSLLTEAVDPKASVRADVEASGQSTFGETVLDIEYRNFNPNYHTRRNNIFRSRVSTRSPFGDGEFLDYVVKMPDRMRQSTIPFSGGRLNHPTSRLKMELAREVDNGIERVPYERTELSPRWPFVCHTGVYFAKRLLQKAVTSTNASNTMYAEWYRENPTLRRKISDLLERVADRPLFDRGTVEVLREQHLRQGRNRIRPIAVLTTIECWRRNYLD